MKPETKARVVEELVTEYDGASRTDEGQKILVRLPSVFLPSGCDPPETPALVVLDDGQPTPQLFVKHVPKLPNGGSPRSTSPVAIAGESWHSFSFNQAWHEDTHTAVQFVEGRLRRFALSE